MKRILALLMALTLCFAATAALAETTSLTVKGNGAVTVTADRACVTLGVRETSADALEAQSAVNAKINAIYEALLAAGVEKKDIGTDSLYLYANYDYSEEIEKIVGYTASNMLSVQTTQLEKLGEYIDVAFGAGANVLDYVQFTAQNSEDAQKEALELAVQNAYEKAEVIAAAMGKTIHSVTSVTEEDRYSADAGAKTSNARATEAASAEDSTLVQASSLQISACVTVEFELSEGED